MCCKQRTCTILKSFRCNTYKKQGGSLPVVSLALLGYEDHFRRIIPERRPVEVSILRRNLEPASRQEMINLIPEEVAQRTGHDQPRLAPVWMPYGKYHLHIVPLLRAVERGHSLADAHLPAVGGFVLGHQNLSHVHGIVHSLGIRLEHIQDQPPPRRQMLAHAVQTIHLLPHFQQVLKWPEGNNDQPECFAEIESRHVALNEVNTFACLHAERRALFHPALQHALGKIQPGDPLSRLRQRHRDAPRAAAQLQDGIAEVARGIARKRHLLQPLTHNRRFIVIIRDKRIVKRRIHLNFRTFMYMFTNHIRCMSSRHSQVAIHKSPVTNHESRVTSHESPITASASISTSISGAISLLTSTMLVAGRISPKNSPCALPTFSHSAMFVT